MHEQWLILQENQFLLTTARESHLLPNAQQVRNLSPHFLREFTLGCDGDVFYHCAEIDKNTPIPAELKPIAIRKACDLLGLRLYHVVAKALAVLNWDRTHQFCGRCSHPTLHQSTTYERVCSQCGLAFYPRISPSIIVRINKGDEMLMSRSPHFIPGAYGLIAGFVEAGESAEESVHREVKEEVGIEIKNLHYVSSQAWPFPDSLMLAYTAEYKSGELIIDHKELEIAGWYRYDNLPGLPSSEISLARQLIDDFVAACHTKK